MEILAGAKHIFLPWFILLPQDEEGSGSSDGKGADGGAISTADDEVPAELGEDELSLPPQPAKPGAASSAKNIQRHRRGAG